MGRLSNVLFCCLIAAACSDGSTIGPDDNGTPPPGQQPPPGPQPPVGQAGDITLNSAVRYQTIVGWEAHASSSHTNPLFPVFQDTVLNAAADMGITRLRLEAWSGIEQSRDYYTEWQAGQISDEEWKCVRFSTENDNADPNVINWGGFHFSMLDELVERVVLPFKQKLAARGEQLYVNLTYDSFVLQCPGSPYHHNVAAEYAEFAHATFLHLRNKYGLVPDAWNMILEPDNTNWRGTAIGNAVVAAATRLAADGFTPAFIAPSATFIGNAITYFDDMIKVPGALQYLDEVSYHRYRTNMTEIQPYLQQVASRAKQHGLRTSMLEHLNANYHELHQDLTIGNVSAWERFALAGVKASPTATGQNVYLQIDLSDRSNPSVQYGVGVAYLRQYFRHIRPGAVRIDAPSTKTQFDAAAFINPNGKYVVVVKATAGGTFTIARLPAGTYGTVWTTNNAVAAEQPEINLQAGGALTVTMPAAGVVTVYAK